MDKIIDIFKCQCCGTIFFGKEYEDVNGLKYNTQELREHFCENLEFAYTGKVHGFGVKVGYCKVEDGNG